MKRQLIAFALITVVAVSWILMQYLRLPSLVGIGRTSVDLVLPAGGGLYKKSNVEYRGVEVGVVDDIRVQDNQVIVSMDLDSSVDIPRTNLQVEVHSRSAIGEMYIELLPQTDSGPFLASGDVIVGGRLPTSTTELVTSLDTALSAVPRPDLKTLIDESGTAFRNAGGDMQQILDGINAFINEGQANIAATRSLIDQSEDLLDTQIVTGGSIRAWSGYLDSITRSVADHDSQVRSFVDNGAPAGNELAALFGDISSTLPVALANLNSVADVARIYNASIEQILVVYPALVAALQSITRGSATPTMGNLDFNLGVGAPPHCITGFAPPAERRSPTETEPIPLPGPRNYCAVPQDDPSVVRGARNLPCMENPGRRAPTVQDCRDPNGYVPLGNNPPLIEGGN
ncbi:MCE family protein [Nocardia gamkensis]|uniref:MCE family protein n=1 Tax=Nocardia gamkensis TaxID=352869 RepID=UPI0037C7B1BC